VPRKIEWESNPYDADMMSAIDPQLAVWVAQIAHCSSLTGLELWLEVAWRAVEHHRTFETAASDCCQLETTIEVRRARAGTIRATVAKFAAFIGIT